MCDEREAATAQHLSPQEVKEVDRVLQAAAREGRLTEENLQLLERIAQRLEEPLVEAANTLREAGAQLLPGSIEHMSQAWVDYQFRHPRKYTRFTYTPDAEWQRLYRTILENSQAGGEFEQSVLSPPAACSPRESAHRARIDSLLAESHVRRND